MLASHSLWQDGFPKLVKRLGIMACWLKAGVFWGCVGVVLPVADSLDRLGHFVYLLNHYAWRFAGIIVSGGLGAILWCMR